MAFILYFCRLGLATGLRFGLFLRVKFGMLWNVYRADAQRVQHHKCKGEAVPTAIDTVNQDSVAHHYPVRLKPTGQFFVGDLLGLPQVFDKRFRPRLVKLTRFQFRQSCIIFDARILKAFKRLRSQCIEFDARIKNQRMRTYTWDPFRATIEI